jgi:hypothetical protein
VPVALNLYKIRDAKGEAGDFFRSVLAQKSMYQGLWLIAPEGKVLTATFEPPADVADWPKQVLADLRGGMKEFSNIAPRRVGPFNPLPYRGFGIQPDGSVNLAVTDKFIVVKDLTPDLDLRSVAGANIDSVTLSAAEWSAVAPPDLRAGSRWTIPEAVGRRFVAILNVYDSTFRHPEEVTDFQMDAKVASVRGKIAAITYTGRIAGTHHGTKNEGLEGQDVSSVLKTIGAVGAYDIQARQMVSLTWVWDGFYTNFHDAAKEGQPARFGTLVEWHQGSQQAPDRLEANPDEPETKIELADATPEDALKTFLLALAAQDEATLRAVSLPAKNFELLLTGPRATAEQSERLKALLEEKPMRRLKAGDPVKMPDGEPRVIKPDDVREGRVVLWPNGAPLPTRLENVGGHWKVFAATFIAARK